MFLLFASVIRGFVFDDGIIAYRRVKEAGSCANGSAARARESRDAASPSAGTRQLSWVTMPLSAADGPATYTVYLWPAVSSTPGSDSTAA